MPDGGWCPNVDVFAKNIAERLNSEYDFERDAASFDTFVNSFEWYNCTMNETGYYTAFYLIK
jgi:hypothetical protein